jgi:hypothetical protein
MAQDKKGAAAAAESTNETSPGGYLYDPQIDQGETGTLRVKNRRGQMVEVSAERVEREGLTRIAGDVPAGPPASSTTADRVASSGANTSRPAAKTSGGSDT